MTWLRLPQREGYGQYFRFIGGGDWRPRAGAGYSSTYNLAQPSPRTSLNTRLAVSSDSRTSGRPT